MLPGPVAVTTFNLAGNLAFKVPVVYSWNLTMEHQFGGQWLGRLAYVGSHSTHLSLQQYLNPSIYIPGSTLSEQARVLFPGYSNNMELLDESGNSHYNSLQFTMQKRFSHGVLGSGQLYLAAFDRQRPALQRHYWRGRDRRRGASADSVVRSPATSSLITEPRISTGNTFSSSLICGISLRRAPPTNSLKACSATGSLAVSLPLKPGSRSRFSQVRMFRRPVSIRTVPSTSVETLTGGVACKTAPCVNYINPAAFGQPAAGSVGNVGKGALTGPGLFDWDMGLFKNIPITERWRVQLRGEFFNTFQPFEFYDARRVAAATIRSSRKVPRRSEPSLRRTIRALYSLR